MMDDGTESLPTALLYYYVVRFMSLFLLLLLQLLLQLLLDELCAVRGDCRLSRNEDERQRFARNSSTKPPKEALLILFS
jgi:hypothetical protein